MYPQPSRKIYSPPNTKVTMACFDQPIQNRRKAVFLDRNDYKMTSSGLGVKKYA